ncbi:unnamed protein product [Scytosiphon promiscuus]
MHKSLPTEATTAQHSTTALMCDAGNSGRRERRANSKGDVRGMTFADPRHRLLRGIFHAVDEASCRETSSLCTRPDPERWKA